MKPLSKALPFTCSFDGCQYGLKFKKPWRVITNMDSLPAVLNRKCLGGHSHEVGRGTALKNSEGYGIKLARAIVKGTTRLNPGYRLRPWPPDPPIVHFPKLPQKVEDQVIRAAGRGIVPVPPRSRLTAVHDAHPTDREADEQPPGGEDEKAHSPCHRQAAHEPWAPVQHGPGSSR